MRKEWSQPVRLLVLIFNIIILPSLFIISAKTFWEKIRDRIAKKVTETRAYRIDNADHNYF